MAYLLQTDLHALVPRHVVVAALDDDGDGQADPAVWEAVEAEGARAIDSRLEARYPVPLAAPLPRAIAEMARVLVAEILFLRRGYQADAQNPFASRAREARARLDRIGSGRESFPADGPAPVTTSVPTIVSEPSRLTDSSVRIPL